MLFGESVNISTRFCLSVRIVFFICWNRRFIPRCSYVLAELTDILKSKDKDVSLNEKALEAFNTAKQSIANYTKSNYLSSDPSSILILSTDASDSAVGAVLQQSTKGNVTPISFFSVKLKDTEKRNSTFGRELLAIYLAIRHFRHFSEGRDFIIFTDHKPLTFSFKTKSDKYSPREIRHLDYISQFSTDIRHVSRNENIVADTLSHVSNIHIDEPLNYDYIAQEQAKDASMKHIYEHTSVTLTEYPIPFSDRKIFCDNSKNYPRPCVPLSCRERIFNHFHNISHPGKRASQKLISDRLFWPSMNKEIRTWAQHCIPSQKTKVHRHTKSSQGIFATPDCRFSQVHVNIVGPLPTSNEHSYILTMIDRFTRWSSSAHAIKDTSAENIAKIFIENWVLNFGTPSTIIRDKGQQFHFAFFQELMQTLGTTHTKTTAYHPCANGLVERFHCQLKAALIAQPDPTKWIKYLPIVLLGLWSTIKEDIKSTAAEMVYGTALRLPGEFFTQPSQNATPMSSYVSRLRQHMAKLSFISTLVHSNVAYLRPNINVSEFVFLRRDTIKKSLQSNYDGPYKVFERSDKYFIVEKNNKKDSIAIDRLKPAYVEKPSDRLTDYEPVAHVNKDENVSTDEKYNSYRKTKSGRYIYRAETASSLRRRQLGCASLLVVTFRTKAGAWCFHPCVWVPEDFSWNAEVEKGLCLPLRGCWEVLSTSRCPIFPVLKEWLLSSRRIASPEVDVQWYPLLPRRFYLGGPLQHVWT